MRVELMLYAGDDLDKARRMFEQTTVRRLGLRHARQQVWPKDG
jgi:hypothetical protein